jgi:type VI secretion system secreted protein Hcp
MAVDMFFKMDPLKGESVDSKHKGEIDVLAWSWGMSQSGSAHMGGGAGSGKVSIQDLSLTKWVDNTSPDLMLACCKGTHYAKAELVVRKAGGAAPLEYIKIYLEEIIISSISTGGSGGEDRLTENISLNFATAKWEYTPQDAKGGAGKKNGPLGWNIQKNEKI